TVSLAGDLDPSDGDSFVILDAGHLSGTFRILKGLYLGNGVSLIPSYSGTRLTLTATQNDNPSQTVYWTGDAGDNDWNTPRNWSTVDPVVTNTPESILPGPHDNVVVDLSNQTINHATPGYDTIGSLTTQGQSDTINLRQGTIDLLGSGSPGALSALSGDNINL